MTAAVAAAWLLLLLLLLLLPGIALLRCCPVLRYDIHKPGGRDGKRNRRVCACAHAFRQLCEPVTAVRPAPATVPVLAAATFV